MNGILLIEDDAATRLELGDILRDHGYQVTECANGQEALDVLAAGARPGLIILDLMMPVMSGWEFRAMQLKQPEIAEIPIILLSGASDLGRHAELLGAKGYLEKPIRLIMLLRFVEQYCR